MRTMRQFLDESGFDWDNGIIICQHTEDDISPEWEEPISAEKIGKDNPILDKPFDTYYDTEEETDDPWKCVRFVAKDKEAIYFPQQDDCGSYPTKVWLDINRYLDVKVPTPYPG